MNSSDPRLSAALRRWWWLALVALVVVQGARSWSYEFVDIDDASTIADHELVTALGRRPWLDYVRPERFGGLPEYMPLKTFSLAVDYALFGASPAAFRAQQQLWYLLCALGTWLWTRCFLKAVRRAGKTSLSDLQIESIAALASLLFVLHPAHVESVAWLSGRKDVMCGAFMLAALTVALSSSLSVGTGAVLCVCTALAMLSKPVGATLLLCFIAQDAAVLPATERWSVLRRRAPVYATIGAMTLLFAWVYLRVSVDGGQSLRAEAQYRLYQGPTWFRVPQQLALFARFASVPFGLSPELPTSLLGVSLADPRAWFAAAAGGALLLFAVFGCWRGWPSATLVALFIAPLTPILIRPPWAQYVAGRYLFVSIAPLALGLAWSSMWLSERVPRVRPLLNATVIALIVAWGAEHTAYDGTFRDSVSLWTQASAQFPDSAALAQRAGQAASRAGQFELAARYYERCLALEKEQPLCAAQYGTMLLGHDTARAEVLLRAALPHDETGIAHRSLAYVWAGQQRAADGAALYRDWLASHRVDAERVKPMLGLALASHDRELVHKALRKLLQVMALETPTKPPALELVQRVAESLEEPELARAAQESASHCARADCFAARMYGEVRATPAR